MGEDDGAPTEQLIWNQQEVWSGRGDLNARPPAPKAGALPSVGYMPWAHADCPDLLIAKFLHPNFIICWRAALLRKLLLTRIAITVRDQNTPKRMRLCMRD